MNVQERELDLVRTFVVPAKRERYIGFLASPKRRPKFLRELYHFRHFNAACVVELSGPSDSSEGLIAELRRRGASEECYVVSAVPELDGTTGALGDIIREVFAFREGTLISCLPGRLAYYEGEAPHSRYLLVAGAP